MSKFLVLFTILFATASVSDAQISAGGGFSLEKSAIAGGGGTSSGGSFGLAGTTGQSAARIAVSGGQFSHPIGFWVPNALAPTAASVSVSGRVITADGAGIRNAVVTLTGANGLVRTAVSGSLGRFVFTEVEVGEVYVISVKSNRFRFNDPTRVISVDDQTADLDFIAEAQ